MAYQELQQRPQPSPAWGQSLETGQWTGCAPSVPAQKVHLNSLSAALCADAWSQLSGRETAGALCLLQDGCGGIGKHLAPQDNIHGVRILSEVVADAPDARDE